MEKKCEHVCGCCHEHGGEHENEHGGLKSRMVVIAVTAVLLVVCMVIERNADLAVWQLLLIYLVPYLVAGWGTLREAAEGVAEGDWFNENFLMTVATLGALAVGFLPGSDTEFAEAVFVMLFFQVGEMFEGYAEGKSEKSVAHLMELRPEVACVVRDGREMLVAPDEVAPGEVIVVKRGERVPLDGVIVEGEASLNTEALTGESELRNVRLGDEVMAGCVSMSGMMKMRVLRGVAESAVEKIIGLVRSASERKSSREAFITRFARVYTPVVVILAAVLAFVPPFVSGGVWADGALVWSELVEHFSVWVNRALIFLVVSCPCALVISVPLTFFAGIGGASRCGVLVKGSSYMDVLADVDTVVFDKTGTLTSGTVVNASDDASVTPVVAHDKVKADSAAAVSWLKALGVKRTVMLSGDRREAAGKVAESVGVDEWWAELLPGDKVAHVERLLKEEKDGGRLAFVGDGINDAPVLKRADVGIAMGGVGSDAALEAADVVLMDDKPSKVATAIAVARRTVGIARQNVWLAVGVKVAVLVLATFGLGTMWMAVFADVGVTVLAVFNAMRALKKVAC